MTAEEIINALLNFYIEHRSNTTLEYTYGFLDAVAVIRDMPKKL